ncbi:twin-arginine translocation pathway signal protein [Jiella sp. 40Bstr34]|uniref:Twin-arginine translocation pathway signal protein n=2 Tax=Jiella pacifica TaxID=2696469 RepID=A0A6N9T6Z2_9HYPH|nr:twin-arginine translocation pathway signal protein [Jiella pacifica]
MPVARCVVPLGAIVCFIIAFAGFSGAAFAETLKSGRFTGVSGHEVSGAVTIVSGEGGAVINFGPDFSFDGAPDPKVAFGHDGYDPKTLIGPLKAANGAQSYAMPAGFDPAAYNEVWIWCEEFAVPRGMAKIE